MAKIIAIHTLFPEYEYSAEEATASYLSWVSSQSVPFQKKAERIFLTAAIKQKHTIAPADVLFNERTLEESNDLYKEVAIKLGTKILKETLQQAKIRPEELDFIITTSCTGFMIPSFDAYVVNNLGLRPDIKKLPITEIGCAAGASALIYANDFLKAYPDKKVAIITLEFPSNTIQLKDFSWDNVIGTAIFADGVACAILGGDKNTYTDCPEIIDTKMYQMPDTTGILGYNLTNSGLKMNLDKTIPQIIEDNFENIVEPFLNKNSTKIKDIDYFLVHPGGVKILDKIEKILDKYGKNVDSSRKIMETYGNMSSSTILFILNEYMNKNNKNKTAFLLSFGPGFSAHELLLRWN